MLSDIHSNFEALQACLHVAPPHDRVVNLGDIVGYGANPNEVAEAARDLGGNYVRGNHDKVVTGIDTVESFNPIAGIAALWNRDQLTAQNLDWLRALPKGPATLDDAPAVQFVHGAPDDEDRYVVTVDDAAVQLHRSEPGITFFGHTHIQGAFLLQNGVVQDVTPVYGSLSNRETWDLHLKPGAHSMINPGSVGQPRDGDWRAAFALFDSEQRMITFCRTPYDLRSAQEKIFAANLPPRLATRLAAGK